MSILWVRTNPPLETGMVGSYPADYPGAVQIGSILSILLEGRNVARMYADTSNPHNGNATWIEGFLVE